MGTHVGTAAWLMLAALHHNPGGSGGATAFEDPRPLTLALSGASGGGRQHRLLPIAPAPRSDAAAATPLLDRVTAAPLTARGSERRRAARLVTGPVDWTVEAIRRQTADTLLATGTRPLTRDKLWAAGVSGAWSAGAHDALVVGATAQRERRTPPGLLSSLASAGSGAMDAEMSWLHDARWRLSLGARSDQGGASRRLAERMVDLAQGARLAGQTLRMEVAFAPPVRAGTATLLGISAASQRIAAHDRLALGLADDRVARASIFLRRRF